MTPDEFRRHGHTVVDLMANYLEELPRGPVWQPVPPSSRDALLRMPLPTTGCDFDALLDVARGHVLPYPFGNGHPRFFGWGNPPPAPEGVLAEFIAATMNPSCAGGDQAAVHLERSTVRWLAELIGFAGQGVLLSGARQGPSRLLRQRVIAPRQQTDGTNASRGSPTIARRRSCSM
jgi:hypothetical protein